MEELALSEDDLVTLLGRTNSFPMHEVPLDERGEVLPTGVRDKLKTLQVKIHI